MPEDFDLEQTGSLGLQLAVMLAKQIDGTIKLTRGEGTRFEIAFPAPSL
jgi:two-component sensor histidine kinase